MTKICQSLSLYLHGSVWNLHFLNSLFSQVNPELKSLKIYWNDFDDENDVLNFLIAKFPLLNKITFCSPIITDNNCNQLVKFRYLTSFCIKTHDISFKGKNLGQLSNLSSLKLTPHNIKPKYIKEVINNSKDTIKELALDCEYFS